MAARPERWVAVLGLAGGLLLVFLTPPFQVADEPAHFFNVYKAATATSVERGPGGVVGFRVPASLPRAVDLGLEGVPFHSERRMQPAALREALRLPLRPDDKVFLLYGRLSPYTAAPYLGAAAAVALGRLCEAGPVVLLYLARLGNLALALCVCVAAVRWVPVDRWFFALVALTPMAMFERSSASADALTDAVALLLVSLVLRLALGPRAGAPPAAEGGRAGARHEGVFIGLLLGAAFLLSATKAVYFLLDLLLFLVPADRLSSRRRVVLVRAGGLAAIATGVAVSSWVAHTFFTLGFLRAGVQPQAQLAGVLAAPLRFLALAVGDYLVKLPRYAAGAVGVLGWADTPLPHAAQLLWGALLLAVAATGGEPGDEAGGKPGGEAGSEAGGETPRWWRPFVALVAAATLLLLSLSQYMSWTPVGAGAIEGLQGRYFLPLLPLGGILVGSRRFAGRWPSGSGAGPRLGGLSLAFVLITLTTLWLRYYGPPGA